MRPWFAYVVGGVLALLAIGGLGAARRAAANPSPQTLSHAQFVSAADGTCYRAATQFSPTRLDRPYTTSLRANLPVDEQMRSTLSGLKPPPNDAAAFQLMLNTLDGYLRTARNLLRFGGTDGFGGPPGGTDLLRFDRAAIRQQATWDQLHTLSAKLGLAWCRWVWTWPQKPPP